MTEPRSLAALIEEIKALRPNDLIIENYKRGASLLPKRVSIGASRPDQVGCVVRWDGFLEHHRA